MAISVPFLHEEMLRTCAEDFLSTHHPERTIPIPIEEIVEFKFGIDIIPMPGFHVNYEVDGFLSTDLTEIRVDQAVYESKSKNRYRFTLAHELSHRILHADIFRSMTYSTVSQFRESRNEIPDTLYARLEFQANTLAGLILVPPKELKERYEDRVKHLSDAGISLHCAEPETWDYLERWLGSEFGVSQGVIAKRAPNDGLWDK